MRSKKAMYSILVSGLQQIILLVIGLILPRLYIDKFGSEINGLVSSIKQFLGYFTIAGAGIGASSVSALFLPISNQDNYKINKILSATKIFYRRASYIFTSMVFILAIAYPYMVKGNISSHLTISLVLVLGIGSVVEQFVTAKYSVLLTADQRAYINAGIQMISNILNAICVIILMSLGVSVLYTQIISTTIIVFKLIMMKKYIKNNYPNVSYDEDTDMKYIENRWDAFSYQLTGMIISYTPIVIITIFCGLLEVSVYSIYNLVFSSVTMIIGVFSFGLTSSFGSLIAENNKEKLIESYDMYESLYYGIVFSMFIISLLLINSFIKIYTKGIDDINYLRPTLGYLFVISGILKNLRTPHITLVEAGGLFKENNKQNIIESILCIMVSIILTNIYGMEGVLMGLIIGFAYRLYKYVNFTNSKLLQVNVLKSYIKIVTNCTLILPSLAFYKVIDLINPKNILIWFLVAILCSLYVISIFCIGNIVVNRTLSIKIYRKVKSIIIN